jgi:hypothetical protein
MPFIRSRSKECNSLEVAENGSVPLVENPPRFVLTNHSDGFR